MTVTAATATQNRHNNFMSLDSSVLGEFTLLPRRGAVSEGLGFVWTEESGSSWSGTSFLNWLAPHSGQNLAPSSSMVPQYGRSSPCKNEQDPRPVISSIPYASAQTPHAHKTVRTAIRTMAPARRTSFREISRRGLTQARIQVLLAQGYRMGHTKRAQPFSRSDRRQLPRQTYPLRASRTCRSTHR